MLCYGGSAIVNEGQGSRVFKDGENGGRREQEARLNVVANIKVSATSARPIAGLGYQRDVFWPAELPTKNTAGFAYHPFSHSDRIRPLDFCWSFLASIAPKCRRK